MKKGGILILDFGSQYTQLIARRFRELNVYTEIHPYNYSIENIVDYEPLGIVLSGGPSSVYDENSPDRDIQELAKIAPILGVCYGMQLIAKNLGGLVVGGKTREYGPSLIRWTETLGLNSKNQKVWMSHGDVVQVPPPGFIICATSETGAAAAIKSERIWGLQFHPEVTHTESGIEILKSFAFDLCKTEKNWTAENISQNLIKKIQAVVPQEESVLCAISGGVDSTVVGVLLTKALGPDRVHCVFVNNGLLRKNEFEQVLAIYKELGLNIHVIDSTSKFLSQLKGVVDPEEKRKIIGRLFLEDFEIEARKYPAIKLLAQGTLYPDVIESVNLNGASVTIKSHHNVGGLPEKMDLKLLEPLRDLFKDEVRALGLTLNIPKDILFRHPFPGPGLAVRILGAVDEESLRILRECDAVFIQALKDNFLYDEIWQAFTVLLPTKSVGVQGDQRSYAQTVVLRAVTSLDGMTADWFEFPMDFLKNVSNLITNKVKEVNRVVLDITSKPPATIEWE